MSMSLKGLILAHTQMQWDNKMELLYNRINVLGKLVDVIYTLLYLNFV